LLMFWLRYEISHWHLLTCGVFLQRPHLPSDCGFFAIRIVQLVLVISFRHHCLAQDIWENIRIRCVRSPSPMSHNSLTISDCARSLLLGTVFGKDDPALFGNSRLPKPLSAQNHHLYMVGFPHHIDFYPFQIHPILIEQSWPDLSAKQKRNSFFWNFTEAFEFVFGLM